MFGLDWNYNVINYKDTWLISAEQRDIRVGICSSCDKLSAIKCCSECNCFMPAKTWLVFAYCPLHKWEALGDLPDDINKESNNE